MARRYDHRVRNTIVSSGNPNLFPELNIPKSTIRDWLRKGPALVVTAAEFYKDPSDLVKEISILKEKLKKAEAKSTLISKTVKILGFQLQYTRVPMAEIKEMIIQNIRKASEKIGIDQALDAISLSRQRFSAWIKRQKLCELEDKRQCGRLSPTQLLATEVAKIKDLVTDIKYRHFSITSLAIYAKRQGIAYASTSTWHRIVHQFKLRRPGKRLYPAKPKVGIRASAPGQIFHLDQTIIKLTDGTRCYIQAIIDNFSRYILAWNVTRNYGGAFTKKLIGEALCKAEDLGLSTTPQVMVDAGSENFNDAVDSLVDSGKIRRILAQIDIDFSNSLIESVFLRLKHWHLYLQRLDSFEKIEEHTNFYLTEANNTIPMNSLRGATPLEVITRTWTDKSICDIQNKGLAARRDRIATNKMRTCSNC